MSEIVSLLAVALVGAFLSVILYSHKPEYSIIVAVATGLFLFYKSAVTVKAVTDKLFFIGDDYLPENVLKVMLKALGICAVTGFTADICRDCGNSALASCAETVGKCAIAVLCLPFLESVVEIALSLIEKV